MIVADTCVWIEFLKRNEPIFSKMKTLLENGKILAIELVFAELQQGAHNKREREVINSYWKNLPKFSIDTVLINAGEASSINKWTDRGVGLIDATILTYCRETQSKLWTIDKKLLGITEFKQRYS